MTDLRISGPRRWTAAAHRLTLGVSLTACLCVLAACAGTTTATAPAADQATDQAADQAADQAPIDFTVLYFNDIHGQLLPFTEDDAETGEPRELGGVARLAARVRAIEEEGARRGRPTFLLFAGDLLMGTPMSMVFRGEPGVLCFREMGVDAFCVGNHEFDFGLQNLRTLAALAGDRVPIISCNIDDTDGEPLFPGSVELPLGAGASLLVAGATTEDTPVTTFPKNVDGLTFHPPIPRIRDEIARRTRPGPVIVLSHMGWAVDRRVAEEVPEILAVVGGHDQVLFDPPRQANGTPVMQAHDRGRYLGRLDARWDPRTGAATVLATTIEPITAATPEDPGVAALVRGYAERLAGTLEQRVATAAVTLDAARTRIRYEETNLGSLFADIMRAATGAEVALLNAGSIRATINRGDITMADLYRAFPYSNELWTVRLDGRTLLLALERSVRGSRGDEDGGFLQVSGLRMVIHGNRPTDVRVGEAALNPKRVYTVAITDFMRAGGDGYHMLEDVPGTSTKLPLRGAIVEAFKTHGTVDAKTDGRITRR